MGNGAGFVMHSESIQKTTTSLSTEFSLSFSLEYTILLFLLFSAAIFLQELPELIIGEGGCIKGIRALRPGHG